MWIRLAGLLLLSGCATDAYLAADVGYAIDTNLWADFPANIELRVEHQASCLYGGLRHNSGLDNGRPFNDTWDHKINSAFLGCEVALW